MTIRRDVDGRLFPPLSLGNGWIISAQADRHGYMCEPREHFETLEEYSSFEVKIDGPFGMVVDPSTLGLPLSILFKFGAIRDANGPSLGGCISMEELEIIKRILSNPAMNAGIPSGDIGWPGKQVWHGTTESHALDIMDNGVEVTASNGGYFGQAFYVSDERDVACGYAHEDDREPGALISFFIEENAKILDLRNEEDFNKWKASQLSEELGSKDFAFKARRFGIDGAYDRSMGGLAIFNKNILTDPFLCEVFPLKNKMSI